MKRPGLLALAVVATCSWTAVSLRIVCTTTIVADVVARVAGMGHEFIVLLPIDSDPHAFEPTPRDLVAIARADVVFLSGAGLEGGLDPILKSASGNISMLSEGLDLLRLSPSTREAAGHDEDVGGVDPHVWFDPTYVGAWVERIADALTAQDPAGSAGYLARAEAYRGELTALDAWITDQVQTVPPERRKLVTDHTVFGYFATRYGFEQVGAVFPGLSSLSQPSAREFAALQDSIRTLDVPVLFVGTTVNRSLAERVAADTGTRVVLLYTGSLSGPDGPAASYLDLMRFDVATIVRELSEEP